VYDPATNAVYISMKVNNGADVQFPNWLEHASTSPPGERAAWPLKIVGTPNTTPTTRLPRGRQQPARPFTADERQRCTWPRLAVRPPGTKYVGYVVGINTGNRANHHVVGRGRRVSSKAGIWMSGGGIVSDGAGRMFFSTGNGVTAPNGPGNRPARQLSDRWYGWVRAGGVLSAQDFFSPSDAATLDVNDQDTGSGGPVGCRPYFGTAAHRT